MQIKALRGAFGGYGRVRRGQIIDVADHQAQQLVKRGLFVPVQSSTKEAAKTAAATPRKDQTGGPTGEAKRSSSSQEAPARQKRRYTKRKTAAD